MTSSLLSSIPKLNGNNYHDWKFAIQMILRKAHCWDVISGQVAKPAMRTGEDSWSKKSEEGLTTIGLTIEPTQFVYIRDITEGPAAWKALADIYEKNL